MTDLIRPETPHRILIAGSLTRDRIRFAGRQLDATGGVVWHAGQALASLGTPVTVVTRTAPGDRALLQPLIEAGIRVVWEPAGHTTTLILGYDPENPGNRTLVVETVAEPVHAESLREALEGAHTLYLGPVHRRDLGTDCIGVIRRHAPARVALDIQGLVRQQTGHRLVAGCSPDLDAWLAVTDVLKASEEEARTLLDGTTRPAGSLVEELAEELTERLRGREFVMTCGPGGAWTWHEGTIGHIPAREVPGDPTGAGDLFFAAYLARRDAGDPCEAAARFATTFVALQLGGKPGPPE